MAWTAWTNYSQNHCIPALVILRVTLLSTLDDDFALAIELIGVVLVLVSRSTPGVLAAFLILLDDAARRPCDVLVGVWVADLECLDCDDDVGYGCLFGTRLRNDSRVIVMGVDGEQGVFCPFCVSERGENGEWLGNRGVVWGGVSIGEDGVGTKTEYKQWKLGELYICARVRIARLTVTINKQ